jgi:hypothetical protein
VTHPGGAHVERKADVVGGKINRADTIGLWPPRGEK